MNHINPNLCTHYLYSFALLHQDTFDLIVEDKAENIAQFAVGLKAKNPNLKTLIAIGGYADSNDGTGKYSNMVSTAANIDTFIGHVVDFVERYRFDGVDLDWEYPSSPEDKVGFSNLLTAMRRVFDTKGYLLTAAVPAGPYYTEPGTAAAIAIRISRIYNLTACLIYAGYDVPVLDRTLDFINLMTYDMHGAGWEPSTADHHAPLYKRPWEADGNNVNFCVNYWISKGASPSKIVMGIPLYGQVIYQSHIKNKNTTVKRIKTVTWRIRVGLFWRHLATPHLHRPTDQELPDRTRNPEAFSATTKSATTSRTTAGGWFKTPWVRWDRTPLHASICRGWDTTTRRLPPSRAITSSLRDWVGRWCGTLVWTISPMCAATEPIPFRRPSLE